MTPPRNPAPDKAEDLSVEVRGVSPDIGAVLATCTDPAHHAPRSGPGRRAGHERPRVTDQAMTATAVTAALLTTLSRRGVSPQHSRLVIAGSAAMPVLRPLLLAAGFGCVTSWDRPDAGMFPLHRITQNAQAVIDLLDCAQELTEPASDHPELIIITPDPTRWARLASPGLLDTIAMARASRRDIEVYHACVLALVAATPPDRTVPDPTDPSLTREVERAAARALRRPRSEHTAIPVARAPHPHAHTRRGDNP